MTHPTTEALTETIFRNSLRVYGLEEKAIDRAAASLLPELGAIAASDHGGLLDPIERSGASGDRLFDPGQLPYLGVALLISYKLGKALSQRIGGPIAEHKLKPLITDVLDRFRKRGADEKLLNEIERNVLAWINPLRDEE